MHQCCLRLQIFLIWWNWGSVFIPESKFSWLKSITNLIQCMSSFSCLYKQILAKSNLRENDFFFSQFRGTQRITVAGTVWWWHHQETERGVLASFRLSPFSSILVCLGSHPTRWCDTNILHGPSPWVKLGRWPSHRYTQRCASLIPHAFLNRIELSVKVNPHP